MKTDIVGTDEERQESREKRRRIEDYRRQDDAKAARESGQTRADAPGTMQLNGTEYVAVTPANTARGGPLHPSLPTRPGFGMVPKEETQARATKKMTASQREAESLKAGPDAIAAMQGSNADVVANRRAIRMANLSAAQMLKAELEGNTFTDGKDGVPLPTVEGTGDEEKEQMEPDAAKAVLVEQGEDEGIDEDVVIPPVIPPVRTDENEGEAEVAKQGDERMDMNAQPNEAEIEVDGVNEAEEQTGTRKRGKKRKANEEDEEEVADRSDIEDPPDVEADQPVSKKKLKVNADGTVEGYVDDVK